MALRQVRLEGDEILRKKSKEVKEIDSKIIQLLDDMADTMYKNDGVGLAAPQVGILKKIIVVDVGEGLLELINPEIIEKEGEVCNKEACLSVPGIFGEVTRPAKIKVKALDRNGETIIIEAENYLAQAICHEIDHLDGILFIDKATSLQRIVDEV